MPTGYTAELMEKGQSFEEFVLRCARAFGALVEMRDDPLDMPIKEFTPSPYYENSLKEHETELARLKAMTPQQRLEFGVAAKDKAIEHAQKWLEKDRAENGRLADMAERVNQWTPPTPDHAEIKNFMLQQIDISMNSLDYIEKDLDRIQGKSPGQFYADAVESHERGIQYDQKNMREEIERSAGRNEWVRQLKESLSVVAVQ